MRLIVIALHARATQTRTAPFRAPLAILETKTVCFQARQGLGTTGLASSTSILAVKLPGYVTLVVGNSHPMGSKLEE